MYPVIHIGPLSLQSSALAVLVALWVGVYVSERQARRRGWNGEEMWTIAGVAVLVMLVSARLVYVGENLSAYARDPLQIVAPTPNTLALDIGLIFGLWAAFIYIQRRHIPVAELLDVMAPGVLLAIAIFTIGQFLSGDAYGSPADVPWSVYLWGDLRHPVQLYDAAAALLGLVIVGWLRRVPLRSGALALVGAAWYTAARVFLDAFRGDATVVAGGYRTSQILALGFMVLSLWFLGRALRAGSPHQEQGATSA